MKKIFFSISLMILALVSRAQSDSSYVELGVNTIRLVLLGFADASGDESWNPYLVTLEGHYKRLGARIGLGLYSQELTALPTDANGKVKTDIDTSATDFRIGINYEFGLHQRWTLKLGLDYYMVKRINSVATTFTNENDQTVSTLDEVDYKESGIAPVFFIQYHITPRVSVGTELQWRIGSFTRTDSDTNSLSDNDVIFEYEGTRRYMIMPTALFLCARF